jgi:hypothetical protein
LSRIERLRRKSAHKSTELLVPHLSKKITNVFSKCMILSRIGWETTLIISHSGGLPVNQSMKRTVQHCLDRTGAPLMETEKLFKSLKNPKKKVRERLLGPTGGLRRRTFGVNRG